MTKVNKDKMKTYGSLSIPNNLNMDTYRMQIDTALKKHGSIIMI